jgi:hypothetical protein
MKSFVRESSQSKYRTLELSADDMSINENYLGSDEWRYYCTNFQAAELNQWESLILLNCY